MICCLKQKYLQGICVKIKFMKGKNQVPQWIVKISMDMSFNMFFKSNFALTFDPQMIACDAYASINFRYISLCILQRKS